MEAVDGLAGALALSIRLAFELPLGAQPMVKVASVRPAFVDPDQVCALPDLLALTEWPAAGAPCEPASAERPPTPLAGSSAIESAPARYFSLIAGDAPNQIAPVDDN